MADRYWVGGAGTWNTSSTTNWSASSGGAGGASAPTSSDNVIFNASSGTGTVTISSGVCLDMTASASSALTFSGTASVYGNMTLGGSGTFTGFSANFKATTTGKTVTSGAKTVSALTFSGVGGAWTLQDNLTLSGNITLENGTFNTNGKTVSAQGIRTSGGTGTPTLTLGASTLTLTDISWGTGTVTLNAGTSNITVSSSNPIFNVGTSNKTFYNVTITLVTNTDRTINSTLGTNTTFNNLTINRPASAGIFRINIQNATAVTVNGTLTISSAAVNRRVNLTREIDNGGSALTLTAAAVSLANVDFYGITGAGAASWTGTSIGNAGNNSNITFTAAKTVYWNLVGGGNALTSTAWATTSGGTPAVANFPLPQDTAIIQNTGLNASATVTFPDMLTPAINASTRTLAATIALGNSNNTYCAGSITLSSAITFSPLGVTFTNNATVTSAGKSFSSTSGNNIVNGTLTLADAFTSTYSFQFYGGNVDLNGNTLTVGTTVTASAGTLTFNGGTLSCTGSGASVFAGSGTFTTVAGTGTGKISLSSASAKTFGGGGLTYNCTLENAGAGALTISGSNTFTDIDNSVQPTTFTFTSGTTQTVSNFSVSGTAGNVVTIGASSSTAATLSKSSGTVNVQYCSISLSTATGGAVWNAYTSLGNVNGGFNSGWNFTVPISANGLFFGSNF